jgi:hypothetical protein
MESDSCTFHSENCYRAESDISINMFQIKRSTRTTKAKGKGVTLDVICGLLNYVKIPPGNTPIRACRVHTRQWLQIPEREGKNYHEKKAGATRWV